MTAKEALKEIKISLAKHLSKQTNLSVEKHFELLEYDTAISVVAQALTELEELKRYPTAEEVCEALSEYYGRKVTFKDNVFWYKTIVYDNEQWIRDVSLKDLSKDNRGDLITMIGRFYENEVKE